MIDTTTTSDLDAAPAVASTDGDDAPDAAHIVSQADLIHSQVTGEAIRALCGKLWVPKRNPDDFPLCPACLELVSRPRAPG